GLTGRPTFPSAARPSRVPGLVMLPGRGAALPPPRPRKAVRRNKVFLSAARNAAEKPVKAAVNIATHPKETVQGIPAGIGRFFDRVQSGASRIVEAASNPEPGEDTAATILKGGGTAARDALRYEQERRSP